MYQFQYCNTPISLFDNIMPIIKNNNTLCHKITIIKDAFHNSIKSIWLDRNHRLNGFFFTFLRNRTRILKIKI